MKAKLICYTLRKISPTLRTQFKRDLLGYKDYSNRGKYSYSREGSLKKIPHYRPIRSVIIVKIKDENQIIGLLNKYKADYQSFEVTIDQNLLKS